MTEIPASHRDLLKGEFATLATVGPDGRPQLSEVWFLAEGDTVAISLNTSRQKTKNLRANPAANVFLLDLAAFIRQADAAYDFLRAQPDADPRRMLVAGHSEGGMYALLVAGSVSPRPAGLALIEPQDERFLSLIQLQTAEQLAAMTAQDSITAATARRNGQAVRRAIADFRVGRAVVMDGLLPAVVNLLAPTLLSEVNAVYVRSDDAVYPPGVAARLPHGTRVLVTEGTADQNVPPSTITPLVRALAAAGTTGPGLRTLNGVNHLLHPPGTANDDQVLAPSVVTALQSWARPYAS